MYNPTLLCVLSVYADMAASAESPRALLRPCPLSKFGTNSKTFGSLETFFTRNIGIKFIIPSRPSCPSSFGEREGGHLRNSCTASAGACLPYRRVSPGAAAGISQGGTSTTGNCLASFHGARRREVLVGFGLGALGAERHLHGCHSEWQQHKCCKSRSHEAVVFGWADMAWQQGKCLASRSPATVVLSGALG